MTAHVLTAFPYPEPGGMVALPSGEEGCLTYPPGWPTGSRKQTIVELHGRGNVGTLFISKVFLPADPTWLAPGYITFELVASGGYACLSIDADGPTPWGDPTEQSRVVPDAVNYVMTTLGSTSAKIGVVAYSMSGVCALNLLASGALNPTNCAGIMLVEPAADLRYFAAAPGYVPPYSTACQPTTYNGGATTAAPGTYGAEIAADYPGGYTAYDPMQVAAAGGLTGKGVPVPIISALDDNVVPPGQIDALVALINDPMVRLVTPRPLGGHLNPWGPDGVPVGTYKSFFDSPAW